ncbi:MAG: cation transporter, partial [Gemmatimonadota bacterium]
MTTVQAVAPPVELAIEGMHCASCVARVEGELAAVPGVTEARVNLADERARVRFQPDAPPPDALIAAVGRAGYKAHVVTSASDADAAQRDARARERTGVKRRLLVAAVFSAPLLLFEMVPHLLGRMGLPIHGVMLPPWVQLALATPVLAYAAAPFFSGAWNGLRHRMADMNTLIAVGTGAAYSYSVVAVVAPQVFYAAGIAPDLYFETAAIIITLILLGRWLELRAKGRTGAAIRRLLDLQPRTARIRRDGAELEVAVGEVVP